MVDRSIRVRRSRPALVALALTMSTALMASGCSNAGGAEPVRAAGAGTASVPAPGVPAATAALAAGATAIDVRTPEEFVAGHIDGAELIDIRDPSFGARIADLDPEATYVVYCRSGNRSATAATQMRALGLDVLDGGAVGDMVAAGWSPSS